jgi:hypothetical protein
LTLLLPAAAERRTQRVSTSREIRAIRDLFPLE